MHIYHGDLAVDDRGIVTYANSFEFKDVKRFYLVENHHRGFVRAWHGHRKEGKYVFVVGGAIKLAVKPLDSKKEDDIEEIILSYKKPKIVYIPPGNYNGFQTLVDDTKVMFYSTCTMEEAKDDDIREPARRWDIWVSQWR